MALNVGDVISGLDPARRSRVDARAAALISEEMAVRGLRKARQLTQSTVARQLGSSQDGVSRLEQRSDLLPSTLRWTVETMGGSLSLIATFPDRPPGSNSPASPGASPATDTEDGKVTPRCRRR